MWRAGITAALVLLGAACVERRIAPDAGRDAAGDTGVIGDAASDTGPSLDEVDRTPDSACAARWIVGARGRVVDEAGSGVADARAQMCLRVEPGHRLVCLAPGTTDGAGAFEVVSPLEVRCVSSVVYRVLLPDAQQATTYCTVSEPLVDAVLELGDAPFVLYATENATTLPPVGDEAMERTVTFSDGLEIDLAPAGVTVPKYEQLSARRLDGIESCVLADAPVFDGVYAFSPEASLFRTSMTVRIPNTAGYAASSEVELHLIGGLGTVLIDESEVEEAAWVQFTTGVVDPTGAFIEGESLTALTWLGYRQP